MTKELQDLAWSVLPKEFKEEVKKIYSALLANIKMYQGDNPEQVGTTDPILWERTLGIKNTLCRIFGEYNLTSDADGEDDEILHVSRKKLQYFYEKLRKVGESHAAFALQSLFGSMCLPDEPANEDNFVSKEHSIDSLKVRELINVKELNIDEFAKSEPKYHIGQYVRHKPTRLVDVIDGISQSAPYIYHFKHMVNPTNGQGIFESDLEPYAEPTEEASPNISRSGMPMQLANVDLQVRLQVAAMAMQGILSNSDEVYRAETCSKARQTPQAVAEFALACGDALIAKCGSETAN